ncbi:MAG: hypothetical protein PUG48_04020 [Clostridia bacterium]|nr:hypothetical protein [Clostridia bacterium]
MKTVTFKAKNGISMTFGYKKPLLVEYIDAASLQGVFATNSLLGSVGQVTSSATVGARTVVCRFAVCITDKDKRNSVLDKATSLFNPLNNGVLTIHSGFKQCEIECHSSAVPEIKRDTTISHLYRFEVDFVCDYPYFRQRGQFTVPLVSGINTVRSMSEIDTPVEIYIPDCSNGAKIMLSNTATTSIKTLTILSYNGGLTVSTKDFTAVSASGGDLSYKIDVSSNIEDFYLKYGVNKLLLSLADSAVLKYYRLYSGVV